MIENAKKQLIELLKNLGFSEDDAHFKREPISPNSSHRSTVVVNFPDGRKVCGTGVGQRKTEADIAAAQVALDLLHSDHPDLCVNWDEIKAEAQAGDALIKLGVYLWAELNNADEKSKILQSLESDAHLALVFDRWKREGDPDLAMWGSHLGKKRKATLVEALLWRRFGSQVIASDALPPLQSLLKTLQTT
ncbi:putative dsRNA-binding protein [Rivularia sp. UHCC 0363]|uniref:putative dsRNA-binding protein n=1 Tax=Rivularia sp. UHCC 0363 TaxID=3110244 RepID=UPI002B216682|nr:putative dsRNA-binding protein [Rivularia sp. UHCC 0363]MEA5599272.1 putative dsRNA-binding protein [Rivularia sp. UHCC 0363]